MNRLQLLSTVAASLLLAAGTAAAQGLHEQKMPERAPAAQRHAPAEKIAPSMHAGEHKMPQTTGQGSSDESRMSGEHTGVSHDQRGAEQDGSQSSMRNGGKASTSGEGSADNEKRGGEKPSITEHQSGKNGDEAQMKRGEESQSKSGEETHGKTRVEFEGRAQRLDHRPGCRRRRRQAEHRAAHKDHHHHQEKERGTDASQYLGACRRARSGACAFLSAAAGSRYRLS